MTLRKKIFTPLIVSLILIVSSSVFAGDPPPVGGDPGSDPLGTPIGGSAPVGEGYLLIIGIVLLYAFYKYYMITKKSIVKN